MFATGFAAIALGIGRATLEEFIDLAARKVPKMGTVVLRDNAAIQAQVGVWARLLSARALLTNTLQELWEMASRLHLAATFAIHQARCGRCLLSSGRRYRDLCQ